MSGNGTLNAFAASTFGYDFVVIHSELFSNTYEKNKEALAFIVGHELGHLRLGHTRLWYQLSTAYVDRVPLLGGFPLASQGVLLRPARRVPGAAGRGRIGVARRRTLRLQRSGRR